MSVQLLEFVWERMGMWHGLTRMEGVTI
jgi:hypothetical protein